MRGWEGSVSLLPQRNSIEPHWCTALDTQKQSGQSPLRNYTRFKLSLLCKDLITFSFFNGESLLLVFCLHKSVSVEQALLCALHALLCAVSATWRFLDASFRSVKKKNIKAKGCKRVWIKTCGELREGKKSTGLFCPHRCHSLTVL